MDRKSNFCHRIATSLLALGLLVAVPSAVAQPEFDEGKALVLAAVPGFKHPDWAGTVLLAAPTPWGGHLGLILNRPTGVSLASAFPQHLPSKQVSEPIYYGGPFSVNSVVALMPGVEAPESGALQLGEKLSLAFDSRLIDRIIERSPNDARYFAGMVLWLPGELRAEIGRGLWSQHPADAATLFRKDTDGLWLELARPGRGLRTQAPDLMARAQ